MTQTRQPKSLLFGRGIRFRIIQRTAAFPPSDYYGVSVAMGPPLVEALTPQAISRFIIMLRIEPGLGRPLIP